jgi:hypothetical protein
MRASEFALKNKFSSTDASIVNRLYGQEEKKEREWFLLLKGTIKFDHSPYKTPAIPEAKSKKPAEKVVENENEPKK